MFTFLAPTTAKKHHALLPDCQTCGLLGKCKHPKQTWTAGPRKQGVLVVNAPDAKAPTLRDGKFENIARLLGRVGGSIHDFAIVPVAACSGGDEHAWKYCQPLLMQQIKALNPEKVLVYGNKALQSLITRLWGHPSELTDRFIGTRMPNRELNAWVCPIGWINPKKNPGVSDIWAYRHAKAAVELQGRPYTTVPDYDKMVRIRYDAAEIAVLLQVAMQSRITAFDYETTGIKPEHPDQEIVSCAVAWLTEDGNTESVAFPFSGEIRDAWCTYLTSRVPKVAANAKFETRWSKQKLGVDVVGWTFDTMLAAHMLNPVAGVAGLKYQAFTELGLPFYAGEVEKYFESTEKGGNAINNIYQCSMQELLRYNAIDALAELDLALIQRRIAGIGNLWSNNLPAQHYYATPTD